MYVQFVITYQYVKFSLLLSGSSLLKQHNMMGPLRAWFVCQCSCSSSVAVLVFAALHVLGPLAITNKSQVSPNQPGNLGDFCFKAAIISIILAKCPWCRI